MRDGVLITVIRVQMDRGDYNVLRNLQALKNLEKVC